MYSQRELGGGLGNGAAFAISGVDFCPPKPYNEANCRDRLDADHGCITRLEGALLMGAALYIKEAAGKRPQNAND